ncbi:unnamed protein product [Gongylonema pulchrum]|uniref:Kinesin motor domain-containing protein n=1 Tax=Gongylonema pulchrum TaxID=637853 RepID=A0A183CU92_9BILA|nr:unnamed protein product [Gongylonema pulchrum]
MSCSKEKYDLSAKLIILLATLYKKPSHPSHRNSDLRAAMYFKRPGKNRRTATTTMLLTVVEPFELSLPELLNTGLEFSVMQREGDRKAVQKFVTTIK